MKNENQNFRRWNRFWVGIVLCWTLIGGYNYLESRIITDVTKLEVTWGRGESRDEPALVFSSLQGGPFVVTHLVVGEGDQIETALDAIAELPHPLFIRGPKARTYVPLSDLKKLTWINSAGEKVKSPNASTPIMALYYETRRVMTTK